MLNERQKTEIQRKINHYFIDINKSELAKDLLESVLNEGNEFNSRKYNTETITPSEAFVAYKKLFRVYNDPNPVNSSCFDIAQYNTPYSPANRDDVRVFLRIEISRQTAECIQQKSPYKRQVPCTEPTYRKSTHVEPTNVLALFANTNNNSVANTTTTDRKKITLPTSRGGSVQASLEDIGDIVEAFPKLMEKLDYTMEHVIPQLQEKLKKEKTINQANEQKFKRAAREISSWAESIEAREQQREKDFEALIKKSEEDQQWRYSVAKGIGAVVGTAASATAVYLTGGVNIPVQTGVTSLIAANAPAAGIVASGGAGGYFAGKILYEQFDTKQNQLAFYRSNR